MTDRVAHDLRAIAVAEGLSGFGICTAEPFEDVRVSIEERKAGGLAGRLTFTFANPERSTDVRSSFPWARRLVVGAAPYVADSGSPSLRTAREGRIARFATRDAYAPLRQALGSIAEHLRARGHEAEVLVDDNRLVDRGAGVRAGVGWWGKNTMVLAPGVGPWLLLGSVVTDTPLETTGPMLRTCGTCSACLPACPTGALIGPGILDARRCLAAIVQAPGVIPREYREAIADRIYGCDDCLEACPPGRRHLLNAGGSRAGIVDLPTILRSSDRTILDRYGHFYIPRRQARYLRRNALVAIGNTGDSSFVSLLAGYVAHPDWLLRLHSAWALGRIGGPFAIAILKAAQRQEVHDEVREEIALDLRELRGHEQVR
ncbi:epoxyqueuosine reductase [bacterium BMS3Abin02]|nr:epoxyqueuosine reductase [bacterium BMS3Abin02]HDK44641.1 tRNA epoxyqueuosine(34) reductase QueG [Actinomycetota bacterium]HDL49048.1 tRNA epoxyqueuosine(34) reductase QueG [Actinomycetota bacterium]